MHQVHDERRIPLTPEPVDAGLLSHFWAGIKRVLGRRNKKETQAQAVRVSNAALRAAQIRRIKRQPGLSEQQRQFAIARVFGRLGSHGGES